jgi:hypothetical protein
MKWLIFVGIALTGLPMFSYGQYIIAWEGKYFDGILIRNCSLMEYLQAKFYMLILFCVFCYLLTIPFVFFGMKFLWIQTVCFIFNIGFNSGMLLWYAIYNKKRMDLSRGSAFNWQGTGSSQFIVMLPTILLPILIVFILELCGLGAWGLKVLLLMGIAGILSHRKILQIVCRRIAKAKYTLAEGYRGS